MAGKTVTNLVLAGTLSLATGCNVGNNPEYNFNGKIGEEQVRFYERILGHENFLEVIKADGSKITFGDLNDDFKLDYVQSTIGENVTTYNNNSKNPVVKDVLQKAQIEFDYYLSKIIEIQTAPLERK